MSPLEIDKWAQDKAPFLAMLFQGHAAFAEDLFEILSYAKNQEHIPGLPEVHPKEWLKLYRNHRQIEMHIARAFHEAGGLAARLVSFYLSLRAWHRTAPGKRTLAQRQELQVLFEALSQEVHQLGGPSGVASYLDDPHIDEESAGRIRPLFISKEFLFLFRIFVPCSFLYKITPSKLFRQARLGNLNALEQLIRLDKSVLADPLITLQVLRLQNRDKYRYDSTIVRAMASAPKFELSPKLPKYLLAGVISIVSEALGYKLKEPDIRSLFNAIAHDKSGGEIAIDPDLPDSPESFSKAIQRDRVFWKSILFPDTTF